MKKLVGGHGTWGKECNLSEMGYQKANKRTKMRKMGHKWRTYLKNSEFFESSTHLGTIIASKNGLESALSLNGRVQE